MGWKIWDVTYVYCCMCYVLITALFFIYINVVQTLYWAIFYIFITILKWQAAEYK